MSLTTTTGDRKWKQTQERTGPYKNNLVSERPEGPMEASPAGSTFLTTNARNTSGKKWTPDTTPDKWEKKQPCQRMTGGNKTREKFVRTRLGGEGSEKTVPDMEALERQISDLRSQLNSTAQIIVAKDNDLERLDTEKEKLQQDYNRRKQRMRQIGGMLWKKGV